MSATPPTWILDRGADGYPAALDDLDDAPGSGAPARLHGCGSRDLVAGLAAERAVTIVGARRSSEYGRAVAFELAGSLAAAGLVVVSGMAYGIDTAAHRGALEVGGLTLAVLACGADRAYPPSARNLYRRVLDSGGAVVSEAPPGYQPRRSDFPERNRIMAALSAMTVLVEAREPSGSRITADRALALGRVVGAVPGRIDSPLSACPHALLRDGAHLVDSAQAVLDEVVGVGAAVAKRIGPRLDAKSMRVLDSVGESGAALESLTSASGLAARDAAIALARLELLGYVAAVRGRYTRTGLVPP